MEFGLGKERYDNPSLEEFNKVYSHTGFRNKLFKEGVVRKLAHQNTKLVFGDVLLEGELSKLLLPAGEMILSVLLASLVMADLSMEGKLFSRRKFVKRALLGTSAWALTPVASGGLSAPATVFPEVRENAIVRITHKIQGWQSHIHPENTLVFFRNALMALKMNQVAQELSKDKSRKVKIGFIVGAGHSGIEDFLLAGPDFCRALTLAHPKEFLNSAVQEVGGVDNFSSAILFELPEHFTDEDLEKGSRNDEIKITRITDEKLINGLAKKE